MTTSPLARRLASGVWAALLPLALACGGSDGPPVGPDEDPDPPPAEPPLPSAGPHFSVLPLPLDSIARISPLGPNNKIFPVGHTYWSTCEREWVFPTDRPCIRARLPLRAPGSGIITSIDPADDGGISVEGPPGVRWGFAHVTPAPGLSVGDSVQAGDTIARMFSEFNFDFGLTHLGLEPHEWVNMERIPLGYRYAFSPVGQFPEPLRSQLVGRIPTLDDPLGRLSYDVAGTAQGNWFLEGTPAENSFQAGQDRAQLFLGRLQERYELRIMIPGWGAPPGSGRIVVDPAAPSWDEITPATGRLQIVLWNLNRDASPNYDFPMGSVLLEMLDVNRLRIEWFDTHDPVGSFTSGARVYER